MTAGLQMLMGIVVVLGLLMPPDSAAQHLKILMHVVFVEVLDVLLPRMVSAVQYVPPTRYAQTECMHECQKSEQFLANCSDMIVCMLFKAFLLSQGVLTPDLSCCESGRVDACGVCDGDSSLCPFSITAELCTYGEVSVQQLQDGLCTNSP